MSVKPSFFFNVLTTFSLGAVGLHGPAATDASPEQARCLLFRFLIMLTNCSDISYLEDANEGLLDATE
jgi:hypothetical protein